MRKSAITRIVVGSITAIILITVLVLGIVVPNFIGNSIWSSPVNFNTTYTYPNADEYKTGGAEIPADGVNSLDITWHAGKVSVVPYDGAAIKFEEDTVENTDYALRYRVDGGCLTIKPCKSMSIRQNGPIRELDKTLTVYLPKSVAQGLLKIAYNSIAADLSMNGIKLEKIDFETVSGFFFLENSECSEIKAENVSGGIECADVLTENADFGTVSGNVVFKGGADNIQVETVSANINLAFAEMPKNLKTGSVSGETTIALPENDGFEISLDKVSGKLKSDFPTTVDGNCYTYGNGENQYNCETISGNVYIKK